MPDKVKLARRNEIVEMVTKTVCQEMTQQKAAVLFKPIKDKFIDTIKQVAEENGYLYVLDLSDEQLQFLPLPSCDDITGVVMRKLNL